MILGYELSGADNDSHMYIDAEGMSVCDKCGYKTDFDYINPNLKIKRPFYDFSYTYDGCCIVSLEFKEYCKRADYSNIEFKKIPAEPLFFYFVVKKLLKFDVEKRKTRFENLCERCGNYESVVGANPAFLKDVEKPLDDGFYRTDQEFGSGNEKNPLIIIGVETYKKMKKEKFKGIEADEIKI